MNEIFKESRKTNPNTEAFGRQPFLSTQEVEEILQQLSSILHAQSRCSTYAKNDHYMQKKYTIQWTT